MLVTTQKGKKDKIHIYIDDEYRMTVDETYWLSLGIREKSEIDEETLSELEGTIMIRRAFNKAVDLAAMREHSRFEIISKLVQRGYDREIASLAADKLSDYGYLDDERFAQLYARELKERKKYGKNRIKQELMRKGVDRDIISAVLDEMGDEPIEEISELIKKKYPRFREEEKIRNRALNALVRYGYRIQDIRKAMNLFDNETNEYYDIEEY